MPSSSIQSFGGASVGIISNSAFASSSRCRPIMCSSLMHRDELMAALVNHMLRDSAVAISAHAWAWATVRKCSPSPYTCVSDGAQEARRQPCKRLAFGLGGRTLSSSTSR